MAIIRGRMKKGPALMLTMILDQSPSIGDIINCQDWGQCLALKVSNQEISVQWTGERSYKSWYSLSIIGESKCQ